MLTCTGSIQPTFTNAGAIAPGARQGMLLDLRFTDNQAPVRGIFKWIRVDGG